MDIESEILKEHSKRQIEKITRWIGNNKKKFAALMDLFLHGSDVVTQRTAWVVGCCVERHPELAAAWLKQLISKAEHPLVHNAAKRNVMRLLQFVEIPRRLQGAVANFCFSNLTLIDSPIAVKAFAMTVLANLAAREPDLKREVTLVIEQLLPYSGPGIQSRAKKVLRQLSR